MTMPKLHRTESQVSTQPSAPTFLDDALCATEVAAGNIQANVFTPAAGQSVTREALALCRACPARMDCLEYGVTNPTVGLYGGYLFLKQGLNIKLRRDLAPVLDVQANQKN